MVKVSAWQSNKQAVRRLSAQDAVRLILEAFNDRKVESVVMQRPIIYGFDIVMTTVRHSLHFEPEQPGERIFNKIALALDECTRSSLNKPSPADLVYVLLVQERAVTVNDRRIHDSGLAPAALAALIVKVVGYDRPLQSVDEALRQIQR